MYLRRLFAVAAMIGGVIVLAPGTAQAVAVGCDATPSSTDIQNVINANGTGAVIQLAEDCHYAVTAALKLKDDDDLLGATSTSVPESYLEGSGQTVDCVDDQETGGGDAINVIVKGIDVSGCDHGINAGQSWTVGDDLTSAVYVHNNNLGLFLGQIAEAHEDIKVDNLHAFDNDHMGIRGYFEDTSLAPRAQVADSFVINNGIGGTECTSGSNPDNCAGIKFFGGKADTVNGGVSPLVCNNEIANNHGGSVDWGHGLWIDVTGDGVPAGEGLLVAGNWIHDNEKQGVRIERSDGHRIGTTGSVNCDGATIDATNVIDGNGTQVGSCVAVRQAENNSVTDNECNVVEDSIDGGRVIEIMWAPRSDGDLDGDGDDECTLADPDDCQKTIGNTVNGNTVHLVASGGATATTFVGFNIGTVADAYAGKWANNDYLNNDYCLSTAETSVAHFRWISSTGTGKVNQPWSITGSNNDWLDTPDPYDNDAAASFDTTCDNRN